MTDAEATALAEANELAAWRDLAAAAPPDWATAHGFGRDTRDGALAVSLRDLPVGMFNRAFGLAHARPLARADIDWATMAVPHHKPWIQPSAGPHEAASTDLLRDLGFQQLPMRWAQLVIPLDQGPVDVPPNDRVRVRELAASEGTLFGDTLHRGYGLPGWMAGWLAQLAGRPGWHLYLTEDDSGMSMGCGALFMNGRSAWLGIGATLPQARNRGGQRLVMRHRLAQAQRLGALSVTTETGEPMPGQPSPSFHNMLGSGFRVCGYRTNWKASASSS